MTGGPVVDIGRLRQRIRRGQQLTGIDRVTTEYLDWALERGGDACVKGGSRLVRLSSERARSVMEHARSQWRPGAGHPWDALANTRLADRVFGLRDALDGRPLRNRLVINTAQSWLQEPVIWAAARASGNRIVAFIHDLIPITHPEYNRPHARDLHEARLKMAVRHASGLIVNSDATLDSLTTWAQARALQLPPIAVLHLGVRLTQARETVHLPQQPYFVILGTIEPRKNHLLLLQVWRRLVDQGDAPLPRLVIVGKMGWDSEPVSRYLMRCEQIAPYVETRSTASDEEVSSLLRNAKALLFPSFAEGFGLPLVEALECGIPVIASPLTAFREIAGDVPDYADPLDGPHWERLIRGYAWGNELEADFRKRLSGYASPTWPQHFSGLERFLASLD